MLCCVILREVLEMARGKLSEEEMNILRKNKYVSDVEENRIIYTNEFKFHYMHEYLAGKKPHQIFVEAGFDPHILGAKRIERASHRWRESYAAGSLGSYRDGVSRKGKEAAKNQGNEEYEKCLEIIGKQKKEIEFLKRENDFLRGKIEEHGERIEITESQ